MGPDDAKLTTAFGVYLVFAFVTVAATVSWRVMEQRVKAREESDEKI